MEFSTIISEWRRRLCTPTPRGVLICSQSGGRKSRRGTRAWEGGARVEPRCDSKERGARWRIVSSRTLSSAEEQSVWEWGTSTQAWTGAAGLSDRRAKRERKEKWRKWSRSEWRVIQGRREKRPPGALRPEAAERKMSRFLFVRWVIILCSQMYKVLSCCPWFWITWVSSGSVVLGCVPLPGSLKLDSFEVPILCFFKGSFETPAFEGLPGQPWSAGTSNWHCRIIIIYWYFYLHFTESAGFVQYLWLWMIKNPPEI